MVNLVANFNEIPKLTFVFRLPPLLAPIYRDNTVMTVPIIDGIDHKSFEYRPVYADGHHYRGIFEWGMLYKENEVPKKEQKRREHNSEPYQSPTHAGGLFAINREYFLKLGAYDPGLLVWGGMKSIIMVINYLKLKTFQAKTSNYLSKFGNAVEKLSGFHAAASVTFTEVLCRTISGSSQRRKKAP